MSQENGPLASRPSGRRRTLDQPFGNQVSIPATALLHLSYAYSAANSGGPRKPLVRADALAGVPGRVEQPSTGRFVDRNALVRLSPAPVTARGRAEDVPCLRGSNCFPQGRHSTADARVGSVIATLRERARARVPFAATQSAVLLAG
jgi:hypothetical protein